MLGSSFNLYYRHVIFGVFASDGIGKDQLFAINLVILLTKFHIHKAKYSNQKPTFLVFHKEFIMYLSSIVPSDNQKAIKTVNIFAKLNVI